MLTAKEAYERSREIREKSYNECFKMISDNISIAVDAGEEQIRFKFAPIISRHGDKTYFTILRKCEQLGYLVIADDRDEHTIISWRAENYKEALKSQTCDDECSHQLNSMSINANLEIIDNTLYISSSICACGEFEEEIKINYCPICGKVLNPELKSTKIIRPEEIIDECEF